MILSSRPDQELGVLIEEDLSVDPPMVSVTVNGQLIALKPQEAGFSLFDIATILHTVGVAFEYEEVR